MRHARAVRTLGRVAAVALAGACWRAPCACATEETAAQLPAWLSQLTLNGFVTTSYSYNFNRPDSRTNQLRVFDFTDNSFKLDLVELVLQRAVAKPGEAGFRVDLALGASVPRVSASAGLFRNGSATEDIDLQQAFASIVAPVGTGLRFDVGKFVTPHGFEVIEGYDGWNDNATRSLLFGYAIPFTHTGARATYAFSERLTAALMVVNGWDVSEDNNRSKSVGGQLVLTPAVPLTLTLSGMIGPERADNEADRRAIVDGTAVWKLRGHFTLGANADVGSEQGLGLSGGDARWDGFAGYARATRDGTALSLRAELFEDRDGARTGTPQRLTEITLTPEARLTSHMLVRADVRVDHSDHSVFEKGAGVTDSQPTVLLNLIYGF